MSESGMFSHRTREAALRRFQAERFDLLVIGAGITGAAVARDAASRGLKVAIIEREDISFGTSSRSSKLIHGGLRYLERFELGLVYEALSERSFLLRTVSGLVRPLKFYWPVYRGDRLGRFKLTIALWLYDLLAVFRIPQFHQALGAKKLQAEIPVLNRDGLKGGFSYYDAMMWDDALTVETLRSAVQLGAAAATYVEALTPLWDREQIVGFRVRDREAPAGESGEFEIRADRIVSCVGPWTDQLGAVVSPEWKPWLSPSKGVHLIFDAKRLPVPGALVMSQPEDGRISFVIPRPDYGSGVVIVGTTDSATQGEPGAATIDSADVGYLLKLLSRYFPSLKLTKADIVSAYVGVRPLVGGQGSSLQKVSREHFIDEGPGGTVWVAGGKYTTHRKMAEEIVEFALARRPAALPTVSKTQVALNSQLTPAVVEQMQTQHRDIPSELWDRYGAEAVQVQTIHRDHAAAEANLPADPEGFPYLHAQLRHQMRDGLVMHLDDFYFRRTALYAARMDHGWPWAESLARVWAEEKNLPPLAISGELSRLRTLIDARDAWRSTLR